MASDCPPFLEPRLRLFLSADIVGSTSLKQTRSRTSDADDHSKRGPAWFSAIQGFYFEAAQAFLFEWVERKAASTAPVALYGEEPTFWKSVGDEVLFTKVLTDHRQLATTLHCWFTAVSRMKDFLKRENSSLDVKCTAWLAGFPYRNREVVIGKYLSKNKDRVENYYKESGNLLNRYYGEGNSEDISVDYIGPSIDTGFRLTGFSSSRKMVLSIDAAYLLSMTSFDGEVKRIDLHYDGSHNLKGVMGGAPYPVFWTNMSSDSSLAVMEDKLRPQTVCHREAVKEYCDAFYEEHGHFVFRPFIKSDVGQTMAKRPDWYDSYHASLIKNFNLPDNEYEDNVAAQDESTETLDPAQFVTFVKDVVMPSLPSARPTISAGDEVMHTKYGTGTVLNANGRKLEVNFYMSGIKTVLDLFVTKI